MNDANSVAKNVAAMFSFDQEKRDDLISFETQVTTWEEKTKQMVEIPEKDIKTIQDKEFMDAAFKTLIKVGFKALEKMELDLKLGADAKSKEAFAMMQTSMAESLEKMQNYLFKLKEMEVFQTVPAQQTNVQNIFNVDASSSDMMDLIDKAKARSEITGVKAKFNIDTEKQY